MMERKNLLVILSLVVIASGCSHTATGATSSSSSSVAVENFSAFPQDVFSNQQVRLTLTLINDGGSTAENVRARLFNVPFADESDSNNNVWRLDGSRTISFGTLENADEQNNLPARESNQYWTLDAPDLADGVTIPYQFTSRIYYEYGTRATTTITLMDQQRFREEGEVERPSLDNTAGPIQMEIRTRSPIVFYPDEEDRQSEMCVVVRNTGSGTPFLAENEAYNIDDSESNKVRLTIPDQGNIEFRPSENPDANTAVVEILGNRGIGCFTIEANAVETQTEVPVVLEADYGYYKETDTSVTVRGSSRFGGGDTSPEPEDNPDDTDEDDSVNEENQDTESGFLAPPE